MINILNHSDQIQQNLQTQGQVCTQYVDSAGCFSCLRSNFQTQGADTYNCLIKLALYTINYGPIYVSEIYHFLEQSQLLENNFTGIVQSINVMSLGCGFGPDDIALNKYRNDKQLDINFNYHGYDIEPFWNYITNTGALPISHDILAGFDCTSVNILFINKLFSTLKNNSLDSQFLTIFQIALQSLPVGSFVIFNDINNINMGRDDFNTFAVSNSLQVVGKYFFNVQGTNGSPAYNSNYTAISSTHNICQIPQNFTHTPKPQVNQTVFFLYQKVV